MQAHRLRSDRSPAQILPPLLQQACKGRHGSGGCLNGRIQICFERRTVFGSRIVVDYRRAEIVPVAKVGHVVEQGDGTNLVGPAKKRPLCLETHICARKSRSAYACPLPKCSTQPRPVLHALENSSGLTDDCAIMSSSLVTSKARSDGHKQHYSVEPQTTHPSTPLATTTA